MLGTYYTNTELARILTRWCLDSASRTAVLDPTCGDGVFLHAVLDRLIEFGVANPGARLFGVDVDTTTEDSQRALALRGVPQGSLLLEDFLLIPPRHFGRPMDIILGNPPYVRHHLLDRETVERGRRSAEEISVRLPKTCDLWAYVVVHGLRFLNDGGRMAFLLPTAILQTDYARPVVSALESRFRSVHLIHIRERQFAQASERTVVLLADGFRSGRSAVKRYRVQTAGDLSQLLGDLDHSMTGPDGSRSLQWQSHILKAPTANEQEKRAARVFQDCLHEYADPLSAYASIRIGTVTGANGFFVRRPSDFSGVALDEWTMPVVSRASWLRSPIWTRSDQQRAEDSDKATRLLLLSENSPRVELFERWIDQAEGAGLDRRYHCSMRTPWYALHEPEPPDAFIPYMGVSPPRLTANSALSASTNTVHGVRWHMEETGTRAILSSWTTLFGIAVELLGRVYGKGVLKIEPSAAADLPVLRIQATEDLIELDQIARQQGREPAISLADQIVLSEQLGVRHSDIQLLRAWQRSLQSFRVRSW